jgi:integrase/recombinase XerD
VAGEVWAMSGLQEHLDDYLSVRRSLGYQLQEAGRLLPDFVCYARSRGETTVRMQSAIAWAGDACSEGQRRARLSMVRGFARYLAAFEASTEVPPQRLGAGPVRSIPHIYSQAEIARLMGLASALSPAPFGATIATLIGLMASTGLRPGEVRRLDRQHVDLAGAKLTVGHSKSGRSRRLPLHPSTVKALGDYALLRERSYPHPRSEAFFLSARGARLTNAGTSKAFRALRAGAALEVARGRHPAVLGDLRHTFAVSTLLSWHRAGVDVQRQLPVLSSYMGHLNPAHTYWYLEATPELMALVAERLERLKEVGR